MKKNKKSIFTKDYEILINLLLEARKEANLSQKEVGDLMGWRQDYISKLESKQRRIDIIELSKLAKIYKKSLDHFINHIK